MAHISNSAAPKDEDHLEERENANHEKEENTILRSQCDDGIKDVGSRLNQTFHLHIHVDVDPRTLPNALRTDLKLDVPGCRTVNQLKADVNILTNIPPEQQVWTGWPLNLTQTQGNQPDPNLKLAETSINPEHHEFNVEKFEVERFEIDVELMETQDQVEIQQNVNRQQGVDMQGDVEILQNVERQEDVDMMADEISKTSSMADEISKTSSMADEISKTCSMADESYQTSSMAIQTSMSFLDEIDVDPRRSLIPDDVTLTETEAAESFYQEFVLRYAPNPHFFIGTLQDAIAASCAAPISNRCPLALYLHHDRAFAANIFCSRILCNSKVAAFLNDHFVIWGWDLTHEANNKKLGEMLNRHFGKDASNKVRGLKLDELPVLIVIIRQRGVDTIVSLTQGNLDLEDVKQNLKESHQMFVETKEDEMESELMKEQREELRREQEMAFEESLAADREKERLKLEEKQRETEAREKEEETKTNLAALLQTMRDALPVEPPAEAAGLITRIRMRKPDGEFLSRRFHASAPLLQLFQFAASEGYPQEDYKLLCSWPRRDLTKEPREKSFKDSQVFPEETVFVRKRVDEPVDE